jgi:MFS transporter, OPA family, sugar phosphate sensor protein UhpC
MRFKSSMPQPFDSWRSRVFVATWVAYAGFYFCRKNLPVVQPVLMDEFGWSMIELGLVITAFQLTYAVGQLLTGIAGDRLGARNVLAIGLGATILLNIVSGFAASVPFLIVVWALNGFAQATGWPVLVRTMSEWFSREERGRVMGVWSTNYQVGDAVATSIAASAIGMGLGWRWGFWLPALALAMLLPLIFRWHRNSPGDVSPRDRVSEDQPTAPMRWADLGAVLKIPALWGIAAVNATLKFVMYILFFWSVTYLVEARDYPIDTAGYLAVAVPLGGISGAIFAGWISDKLFGSRRMPVTAIMLVLLAASVAAVPHVSATPLLMALLFAFVGFALYGPESLLAATAAVEFAPPQFAATGVGLVNAVASSSGVLAGVVGAVIVERFGWTYLFYGLAIVSLSALAIALPMWHARGRH